MKQYDPFNNLYGPIYKRTGLLLFILKLEWIADTNVSLLYYTYIPLTPSPRRGSRGISGIPLRCPRFTKIISMSNTADVTGKPIAV
jgi:hypothetical protein